MIGLIVRPNKTSIATINTKKLSSAYNRRPQLLSRLIHVGFDHKKRGGAAVPWHIRLVGREGIEPSTY